MSELTTAQYTQADRQQLLGLARQSLEAAVGSRTTPDYDPEEFPLTLRAHRACFVTLTKGSSLRGCTGVLFARAPLVLEVVSTARQSALRDPRFAPVTHAEVVQLTIEISVLTQPTKLIVSDPSEIPGLIRPFVDGVILSKGLYCVTFLPQVWEYVSSPTEFLDQLCKKIGFPRRAWLYAQMDVEVYQVEEFSDATATRVQSAGI